MIFTRRKFFRVATAISLLGDLPPRLLKEPVSQLLENEGWVEHIPVRWVEPAQLREGTNVVILTSGFTGTAESMSPYLQELAGEGFLAVSFDHWQHGRRGTETPQELGERVFSNFRRRMWPILGHGVLDTSRVIDWIQEKFTPSPNVHVGGFSMGGDIAVAAAGNDTRIKAVAAIVATADWLRPGMRDPWEPGQPLIEQGEPDSYAQFFYKAFNPLTHLQKYHHGPAISFECAAEDKHVPPDGALRFREALEDQNAEAASRIRVNLHEGLKHGDLFREPVFWKNSLEWFLTN